MTRVEALISLNMFGDIGSIRLKKLLEFFDKPENILKASPEKLMAVSGIGKKIAFDIHAFKKEDLEKELGQIKKYNLKLLTLDDKDYPDNLRHIPDPAILLYVKGELKDQDKFSLAIVGSRRASFYGLSSAERFAFELAKGGLTIVSGMARGIDTQAHRGALKAGGRTIAVMGSGFGHIYPPENKKLVDEISQQGAVISEFPCNARPLGINFPRRNRIISGLSQGVLVVEAARNSGALITADFALEQGREVFCLPGKVDSQNSFGTNTLIKQGAKLVTCLEDILEELNIEFREFRNPRQVKGNNKESKDFRFSQEEQVLYDLVSDRPSALDDILEKSKLNLAAVMEGLLSLEMKQLIRQMPGKQFMRV